MADLEDLDLTAPADSLFSGGTVLNTWRARIDVLNDALGDITTAEANQVENIAATTISAAQWGYLGALDQGLTTTSTVTFGTINAFTLGGKLTAGAVEIEGSAFDINGGTIDGITALTAGGHLDIGAYGFRANTLTADGLTAGRVVFTGTAGLLAVDSDMTFVTDTLTVTKLGAFTLMGKLTAGAVEIEGSAFDINGGTIASVTLDGAVAGGDQGITNVGDMTFADGSVIAASATDTHTLLVKAGGLAGTSVITISSLDAGDTIAFANVTALVATGDLDIGAHDLRAATVTPDGLTATRVVFAGTAGVLSDDSGFTFVTDTLTVTKIGAFQATGAINFDSQNMTNVDIDSGTIGGVTLDGAITMSMGSDADGDVYYRASNVLTRLAKGTASKVLAMNSGATAPEWTAIAVKDADADTMIQVEESADEDIIRMDVAGTEAFHLSAAGILTLAKQSGGRAYNTSANQRLVNSSVILALFDSENFDHQNEWDTSVVDGTATATTSDKLVDTGNFTEADAYYVGRWVYNTVDYTYAIVTAKDSDDQLSIDTDIMANTETYKLYRSRFTVTEDGTYMIALSGAGKEIAAGKQVVDRLYINGVQKQVSALYNDGAGDRDISALLLASWQLSASDYVELRLWHDDTGTQQFYNEDHRTWMSIIKVD